VTFSKLNLPNQLWLSVSMNLKLFGSLIALAAALSVAQPALSAGDDVADGHRYFVRYCASCHGTDALGDGPVAKSLVTPPANLRKLADKYGLPLPAHKIAEMIDGRDTARAHGSHEMPVWGEKLYELGHGERGEYGIGEVIGKIIAYLNTIQDRRTAMR
jgi:mono/diheme cytochrome c family protein